MLHLIACYQGKFNLCVGVDDVVRGAGIGNTIQPDRQLHLIVGILAGEAFAAGYGQGEGNPDGYGNVNSAGEGFS